MDVANNNLGDFLQSAYGNGHVLCRSPNPPHLSPQDPRNSLCCDQISCTSTEMFLPVTPTTSDERIYPSMRIENVVAAADPYSPSQFQPQAPSLFASRSRLENQPHSTRGKAAETARRSRRKLPSCDGCRKHKVKCNATETSGCSACSTRKIECCFTRDSKYQVSSSVQVEVLKAKLKAAEQKLSQRQTLSRISGANDANRALATTRSLHCTDTAFEDLKTPSIMVSNVEGGENDLRNKCGGSLRSPTPYRQCMGPARLPHGDVRLPSKYTADRLVAQYYDSVHAHTPLLHWPTFQQLYEQIYHAGTLTGVDCIKVAVFFAVLACGTLTNSSPDAPTPGEEEKTFIQLSMSALDFSREEMNLDHVRANLLLGVFHMEMDCKSTGRAYMSAAILIAQDLGLHTDPERCEHFEADMRRRIWWALYIWDRIFFLDTGRLLHISDRDCKVAEPILTSDEYVQSSIDILHLPRSWSFHSMSAMISIVRMAESIKMALKGHTITAATLDTYDEHFTTIVASCPDILALHLDGGHDAHFLSAACALQASRFLLYRHNLSLARSRSERREAFDRLVTVAEATTLCTQRALYPAPINDWSTHKSSVALAFLATHLWRCTLVLAFRAEYAAALNLSRVSATIGDLRRNNMVYGRHLSSFLDLLAQRLRAGTSQEQLEDDETILAYVSGDMLKSVGCFTVPGDFHTQAASVLGGSDAVLRHGVDNGVTTCDEDWSAHSRSGSDWERIQHLLKSLLHESQLQVARERKQTPPALLPNATLFDTTPTCGTSIPILEQQNQSTSHHLTPPTSQCESVVLATRNTDSCFGKITTGDITGRCATSSAIRIKDIV